MTEFVCEVDEQYRFACEGLGYYGEHERRRYCVLHLPSKLGDAAPQFWEAIERKCERRDFSFSGVYFPSFFRSFSNSSFESRVAFNGATFEGETSFPGATFEGGASFRGATFEGEAYFAGSTFEGGADFSEVTIKGMANFIGATFSDVADFAYATFNEKAWFPGGTFGGKARFHGVTFGGAANFAGATFKGAVDFSLVEFREAALFSETKTNPRAEFVLRYATMFNPERISFHNMYLRPSYFVEVDPQKFDFTDVEWFKLPNADILTLEDEIEALGRKPPLGQEPSDRTQSLRDLQKVCRKLTSNAEENRDYPAANKFYYWSMEALRKEGWTKLGLIGTLYWALSGYGVRAARAFWVLIGIWAAFSILYVLVDPSEFTNFGQGIGYIWQAAVYSLLALARLNPEPRPEEPGIFQFLVGLEGILGPLQIALLALAVRRKVMR